MKTLLRFTFILCFLFASAAKANDVIMATSEDLKEFDNLISKEAAQPPTNPQQLQNQKKLKKPDARATFEQGNPQNPDPNNTNPNLRPPLPPPNLPPPNQDNRPPPGAGNQTPPPPHP